jgi:hypothetical protein
MISAGISAIAFINTGLCLIEPEARPCGHFAPIMTLRAFAESGHDADTTRISSYILRK